MAKAEKYIVESKNIKMFLKEDFLEKMESLGDVFPISLVFMAKDEINDEVNKLDTIVFSHQNDKEVENNILHVNSQDTEMLDKIIKELEKNG